MINKKSRRTLGIVKNFTEVPMPGNHAAPVKRALARISASVIVDQYGSIRACGQDIATLAGIAGPTLSGQPIKSLLPALPFQARTPGYNVAFAVFHANTGRRTLCKMQSGVGIPIAVDVTLTILETTPAYLFSLEIRKHATLTKLVPDASASGKQQPMFQRCA